LNRPAVVAALGLVCGIYAGHTGLLASPWQVAAALLIALALLLAARARSVAHLQRGLVGVAFVGAGALIALAQPSPGDLDPLARHARDHPGQRLVFEGRVRDGMIHLPGQEYGRAAITVDHVFHGGETLPLAGGLSLRWSAPEYPLYFGDRVRFSAAPDITLATVNHDLPSFEDYLRARGLHSAVSLRGSALEKIAEDPWSPWHWAGRLRQWQAEKLAGQLPRVSLPFVLTVWLGERGGFDRAEMNAFIQSGTAHVLSVSGIHVAIIHVSLTALLAGLIRDPRRRAVVVLVAVVLFAVLAGARIATLRAACMFALALGARMVNRESDTPTVLGWSALLFLTIDPLLLFDAGFLLSFGSVASILLLSDPIAARLRLLPETWRGHVALPIAAQALPFPVAAHYFQVLPLLGVVANLVVVPLLTAVLWLAFITVVLAAIAPPVAGLFAMSLHGAVSMTRAFVGWIGTLPMAYTTVTAPTATAAVLFWLGVWLGARALGPVADRRATVAGAIACAVLAFALWSPARGGPQLDMLDVGHGDSIFVRTGAGGTLLVDGGDRSAYADLGAQVVGPFLHAQGVRRLDVVLCSHPDRDHSGGLFHVLERFGVGELVLSGAPSENPMEAGLIQLAGRRGIPVRRVFSGEEVAFPGGALEVLHPPRGWGLHEKTNNRSIAARLLWDGPDVLLTGDIESSAERLLATQDCRATILKTPHHGSHTSSSPALLDAVQPVWTICSTDTTGNRRPMAPAVAARYAERGINIWRTDHGGGLRIAPGAEGGFGVLAARAARGYLLAPGGVWPKSAREIVPVPPPMR